MDEFEYAILSCYEHGDKEVLLQKRTSGPEQQKLLCTAGADGWELIAVAAQPQDGDVWFYMKQRVDHATKLRRAGKLRPPATLRS